MSADTILTMANGVGIDLLAVKPSDIDFVVLAEHVAKEKRFNGATPGVEYSVAQHMAIGAEAIIEAGYGLTAAGYFLVHDIPEAFWKDDPTPKKRAIAQRISERCGVTASAVLSVLAEIDSEHEAAVHRAAGLTWPIPEAMQKIVKRFDKIMFVTEWRDLMRGVRHPDFSPYADFPPLPRVIEPQPWVLARGGWLRLARRCLPAISSSAAEPLPQLAHGKTRSEHAGPSA